MILNMMKRNILLAALAAVILPGCAKTPATVPNDAQKAFLEAWIEIHHPKATKTGMGAYVLDESAGQGASLGDRVLSPYVRVNYTVTDLDGIVKETNSEALAKQLGTYKENNFYGPKIWTRLGYGIPAGVEEALSTMKVGGRKVVMIPGWLLSTKEYADAEDYYKQASGDDAIYTIEAVDRISDIVKWEVDSLCAYMQRNFPSVALKDSLKNGFYYVRSAAPKDTCGFKKDTTIYVNYIGRLLNGTVFDTNIADTAKFYGIYERGKSYGPSSVTCNSDYASTKMGSSSLIDGFAFTIAQMHSFEKGTGIFYSAYGYEYSGSGETIPPYSPLRFDIEIVSQ